MGAAGFKINCYAAIDVYITIILDGGTSDTV